MPGWERFYKRNLWGTYTAMIVYEKICCASDPLLFQQFSAEKQMAKLMKYMGKITEAYMRKYKEACQLCDYLNADSLP
jgi:hypothetical protein